MQLDPSWLAALISGLLVAFFAYKIKSEADSKKEMRALLDKLKEEVTLLESKFEKIDKIEEEVLHQRDSLTILQSTSVNEVRARDIANEVIQPLKGVQDEIKQDVKDLLREISNLSQLVTEVRATSRRD